MSTPPPLPPHNPYAAPAARVDDAPSGTLVLADRGIRLVAVIVDSFIFGILGVVAAIAIPALAPQGGDGSGAATGIAITLVGLGFLALIVVNIVLLYRNGQTIGKRLFNIKIVRSDGNRCELWRIIFLRVLPIGLIGAIPLIGPLVQLLVDPLFIFRNDCRCLHDLIADTIVIKA